MKAEKSFDSKNVPKFLENERKRAETDLRGGVWWERGANVNEENLNFLVKIFVIILDNTEVSFEEGN